MNILMLGNGFDLNHKLPTTYLCFLKTMECLLSEDKTPIALGYVFMKQQKECKMIKESCEEYEAFYNDYFFDEEDQKLLANAKVKAYSNIWLDYFIKSYNKELGWIDFEKEISDVISAFSDFFNNTNFTDNSGFVWFTSSNYIVKRFGFFIDKGKDKPMSINKEYLLEKPFGSGNHVINIGMIYDKLYNELIELSEMLKDYLYVFVDKPLLAMKEKGIVKPNKTFAVADKVITFNYTNTFEKLYSQQKNPQIIHLHGSVDNKVVLGVNNDEEDEIDDLDTTFVKFKKYYQRALYKTDIEYLKLKKELKIINGNPPLGVVRDPVLLMVMGHSLDITDRDIIVDMFMRADKISIYYHSNSALSAYIKNIINIFGKEGFDDLRLYHNLTFIETFR